MSYTEQSARATAFVYGESIWLLPFNRNKQNRDIKHAKIHAESGLPEPLYLIDSQCFYDMSELIVRFKHGLADGRGTPLMLA